MKKFKNEESTEPLLSDRTAAGAAGVPPVRRDDRQAARIRQQPKKTPNGADQQQRPAPSVSQASAATSEIQPELEFSPSFQREFTPGTAASFQRDFTPDTADLLSRITVPAQSSMSEILQAMPHVSPKTTPQEDDGKTESPSASAGEGPVRNPRSQAAHNLQLTMPILEESQAPASPQQELQRRPSGDVSQPAVLLSGSEEAGGGESALEEIKKDLIHELDRSSQDEQAMAMRDRHAEEVRLEASSHTASAAALESASQTVTTGAVKAAIMQFDAPQEALPPPRRRDSMQEQQSDASSAAPDLKT